MNRAARPHLASFIEDFRRHGRQIAVVSRHGLRTQTCSYEDLADLAARFAAELDSRGIHKGDRVLLWGENAAAWIAAFFGCLLRGVLAVPIDAAGSAAFAQRVVREVSPKLAVGGREQLGLLETGTPLLAFEDFSQALRLTPAWAPIGGFSEHDPFQIIFTSGTTGEPKGVVHTHRNILASLNPIEQEMQKYLKYERIFHPLRFLHTLPLSHVFGQFMGIWIPALLAAEVHFASRPVPAELLEIIHRERVSVLATVPRILEILRTDFLSRFAGLETRIKAAEGLPAWRRWWMFRDVHRALGMKFWAFVSGGATLAPDLERFFATLGFVVVQGYGMTETAALVSLNHPFRPASGTIGRVLPGREVRLGEDGEILVRGETVSQATWEGGRVQPRTGEWLATGDLASRDEAGNLMFRGRKKEVIVAASGLNIYPEDLEAALLRQPQIRAAAVIETAGPGGSEPLAALVVRPSEDPAAAVRAANRELAEYQQIRRWVVWPEPDLPRTSTGKVLRRAVAASLESAARPSGGPPPSAGGLAGLIGRITGEDTTNLPDSALLSEDLHLDSLGRVQLESMLESQFGVEISEAAYGQTHTLGQLKELLGAAPAGRAPQEHIYPRWPWTGLATAVRIVFIEALMRPLVALLAKPRVQRDFDQELPKPVLIVSNHVTIYDVPLILYALPPRVRHCVAVAMAGEMLMDLRKGRNQGNFFLNLFAPVQYWLAVGLFNVFPLPQSGDFRQSFAHAGRAMDRGFHVLVFPEGRRSPDLLMHAFQGGAGILWKELQAQALPAHLGGMDEQWFRSGRISIRIGKPVTLESGVDPASAAKVLEQAVRKLSA